MYTRTDTHMHTHYTSEQVNQLIVQIYLVVFILNVLLRHLLISAPEKKIKEKEQNKHKKENNILVKFNIQKMHDLELKLNKKQICWTGYTIETSLEMC